MYRGKGNYSVQLRLASPFDIGVKLINEKLNQSSKRKNVGVSEPPTIRRGLEEAKGDGEVRTE